MKENRWVGIPITTLELQTEPQAIQYSFTIVDHDCILA